jgi:hypothetical protein
VDFRQRERGASSRRQTRQHAPSEGKRGRATGGTTEQH